LLGLLVLSRFRVIAFGDSKAIKFGSLPSCWRLFLGLIGVYYWSFLFLLLVVGWFFSPHFLTIFGDSNLKIIIGQPLLELRDTFWLKFIVLGDSSLKG